jgi:hypothetical protein
MWDVGMVVYWVSVRIINNDLPVGESDKVYGFSESSLMQGCINVPKS